jgi:nitroreductase
MAAPSLDELTSLITARRTNLLVDQGREVPVELVERLCALATWAPNHKRTWPWRFALFTGDARARLGEAFADDMAEVGFGDEFKVNKTRSKYLRTPAALVIGSAAHEKPALQRENLHAVAAGIQNILLGATAAGLATYWGSPPLNDSKRVLAMCEFDPDVHLLGVIYLGWPGADVAVPERPPIALTVIDH